MPPPASLTPRQRKFVNAYAASRNGTQAAIAAGYSESGAGVEAHRLLKKANVVSEIERISAKIEEKVNIRNEQIVDELANIAMASLPKRKMNFGNKLSALDTLAKIKGLYQDGHGSGSQAFQINIIVGDRNAEDSSAS